MDAHRYWYFICERSPFILARHKMKVERLYLDRGFYSSVPVITLVYMALKVRVHHARYYPRQNGSTPQARLQRTSQLVKIAAILADRGGQLWLTMAR
jgi:hypothetical protein